MRSVPWSLGTLLTIVGCWSSNDSALFADNGVSESGSSSGGVASGASAGTDSGSNGGMTTSGSGGSGAVTNGGSDTQSTSGMSGSNTSGGSSGGVAGGGGQTVEIPTITDCAMVKDAVVSELNGHCYRVGYENLTFAQARDACKLAGGHLVTLASAEENELVRDLHDGEHWIGATDGRDDNASGAGTYEWVTDEPWTFSEWEDGQPNAYETDCPDEDDEADCFEHCAFQTDEGDWNDRSCWHTVVSICEWDVEPRGDSGAGGAAGAGAGGAQTE